MLQKEGSGYMCGGGVGVGVSAAGMNVDGGIDAKKN